MSSTPLVSVVLPTYNRAKTLARAIDSVLAQTFQDFELIIAYDHSADGTDAVLARYATFSNVRVLSLNGRNCSAARNAGIAAGKSPYVAFQDSDDEWLPAKLEKAVTQLEKTEQEVGVYYEDMTRVLADGRQFDFKSPEIRRGRLVDDATLEYQVYGLGIQATVIKRECFKQVGVFDEALPRFIDLELFIRLAEKYEFLHHREAMTRYCECEGISTNPKALVAARRHIMEKYHHRLAEKPEHLGMQHALLAFAFNENGQRFMAAKHALKAMMISSHPAVKQKARQELRRGNIL